MFKFHSMHLKFSFKYECFKLRVTLCWPDFGRIILPINLKKFITSGIGIGIWKLRKIPGAKSRKSQKIPHGQSRKPQKPIRVRGARNNFLVPQIFFNQAVIDIFKRHFRSTRIVRAWSELGSFGFSRNFGGNAAWRPWRTFRRATYSGLDR